MPKSDIVYAYRGLYRAALQAVRYSTPSRYQIRDIIRTSFRTEPAENLVLRRVENTKAFLDRAREYKGIEHKILKNILHAAWWRGDARRPEPPQPWMKWNDQVSRYLRLNAYAHYDATVTMLNESMDLCLRSSTVPALGLYSPVTKQGMEAANSAVSKRPLRQQTLRRPPRQRHLHPKSHDVRKTRANRL